MDFEKAIRPLGRFTPMLEKVPQAVRDAVFDIRISVDKPVLLCCGDRILFLREDGDTAQYFSQNNVTATREDVEEIFLRLCGYSVYSHMEEIRSGFVSANRALRVGIGGTAVIERGGIKTVRDVTSLSVRIPRERRGCAEEVLRYGVDLSRGLLLAGAPSSGKTTLLRDIARYIGTAGHRVVVLSNTNRLHTTFWPEEYPEIRDAADHIYLSQDLGMRKPEARIYQHVLRAEGFSPDDTVFFDDNADNIEGANQLGITSILVKDKTTIPDYFAKVLC